MIEQRIGPSRPHLVAAAHHDPRSDTGGEQGPEWVMARHGCSRSSTKRIPKSSVLVEMARSRCASGRCFCGAIGEETGRGGRERQGSERIRTAGYTPKRR